MWGRSEFPENFVSKLNESEDGLETLKTSLIDAVHAVKNVRHNFDVIMLFIPNESIYGFINREDTELVDYALKNHVLLCSPLTLYAVLSLIHQAARNFTMNERASEVMGLVDQFRIQWKKYVEQMDKLGRRIEGLSSDFQVLVNTRTRGLEKPLDKIENISLNTSDDVPDLLE